MARRELPVKQQSELLRITGAGDKQLETLTAKVSEIDAVLRIANWAPFREKALEYYRLFKLTENPEIPANLRALYVRQANEILENKFPEGRKRGALLHIMNEQRNREDPSMQKMRQDELELARTYANMARLSEEGALSYEKDEIEGRIETLRKLASKGWNLARTRKCEWCGKDFQVKRTDALFCSTNCRVKNWQNNQSNRIASPTPSARKEIVGFTVKSVYRMPRSEP